MIIEDNTQAWIGDHCRASDEVPGVPPANRAIRGPAPRLEDVTATVLEEFGVPDLAWLGLKMHWLIGFTALSMISTRAFEITCKVTLWK